MKKRKIGWLLLGIGFLVLGVFNLVQAQSGNGLGQNQKIPLSDEEKAAKKAEVIGKIEERWKTVTCKKVENRMRNRYQKYETNKSLHKQTYEKMKTKIQALVADFKAKGYAVEEVEADLIQLEEKLQKLYTDHDALIMKMKEAEKGACQMTREEAGEKIKEVKQYRLETIKVDIADIHNFYVSVLRPDLIALIQEVRGTVKPSVTVSPIN